MPANRRELDSLVKRKTSTNLGSTTERSSMLIQLTYSLFKYGWFKMFSIEFSKLLSIDMIIKL